MKSSRCAKCGGEIVDGYLVDRGDSHQEALPSWIEGEPQKGWLGGLKTRHKKRLEVTTWRCRKCGFLESYALEPAG